MRYALGVEYDGSEFQGWQQLGEHGGPSVQASLQAALSSV
ncbi:tRNA pseudouridine(38-40) synthase TruA, partial [Xanthomonas oryzae pv. oryzae]